VIYVGTCGFSYKDWIGRFYPPGMKPASMLEYYAARFGIVEIDSTYYAIPQPSLFEGMARRTPAEFRFTVKAPGSITHAPADGSPAQNDIIAFHDAIRPLARAGKLAAVLLQFPNALRPGKDAWKRLALLREAWHDVELIAEFRNRDWQADASLHQLRALGVGWCNVDEPRYRTLMRPSAESTSDLGYIRFHGRNAAKWWKQAKTSAERYDYLYSEAELVEWLPLVAEVEGKTRETYVFFNNHRNGQAAINARQMANLLGTSKTAEPDGTMEDRQLSFIDPSRNSADPKGHWSGEL
jgi:uncharacterized protein YecE (DUF72 family)